MDKILNIIISMIMLTILSIGCFLLGKALEIKNVILFTTGLYFVIIAPLIIHHLLPIVLQIFLQKNIDKDKEG